MLKTEGFQISMRQLRNNEKVTVFNYLTENPRAEIILSSPQYRGLHLVGRPFVLDHLEQGRRTARFINREMRRATEIIIAESPCPPLDRKYGLYYEGRFANDNGSCTLQLITAASHHPNMEVVVFHGKDHDIEYVSDPISPYKMRQEAGTNGIYLLFQQAHDGNGIMLRRILNTHDEIPTIPIINPTSIAA